ncbi:hydrogenase maturation protease [Oculatella sp. LEGE 06141]|uniref:hydrogenase maturation protease n=1 Tax=Oculatella sp. LEGE 06141 TaxID=1828648 RepID=UPI001881E5E3|nr:hydrogenase maturation protease [Oculatella sp. LEGE 06141]MBE9181752.1 hydrogenase maturation protease [Oculatella sp. LEGE 06141]
MSCHLAATLKSLRRAILVVAYGSPLHSHDAVGQQVVTEVAAWGMPNMKAIAVHHLTPDLAEPLSMADLAIFVDASTSAAQEIQVRPIGLDNSAIATGHGCEPQVLLAKTQTVYGYHPQSWWVMVPGGNVEPGEVHSPVAEQCVETVLQEIEQLIHQPGQTYA